MFRFPPASLAGTRRSRSRWNVAALLSLTIATVPCGCHTGQGSNGNGARDDAPRFDYKDPKKGIDMNMRVDRTRMQYDDGTAQVTQFSPRHQFSVPPIYSYDSAYEKDEDQPLPWFWSLSANGERIMLVDRLNRQVLETDRLYMNTFERNMQRLLSFSGPARILLESGKSLAQLATHIAGIDPNVPPTPADEQQFQELAATFASQLESATEVTPLVESIAESAPEAAKELVVLKRELLAAKIASEVLGNNDDRQWQNRIELAKNELARDFADTATYKDLDRPGAKQLERLPARFDSVWTLTANLAALTSQIGSIGQTNQRITFFNMRPAAVAAAERSPATFAAGERRILDNLDLTQVAIAGASVLEPVVIGLGVIDSIAKRIIKKDGDTEFTYISTPAPLHNGSGKGAPLNAGNRVTLASSNNGKYELHVNPAPSAVVKDSPIGWEHIDKYSGPASAAIVTAEASIRIAQAQAEAAVKIADQEGAKVVAQIAMKAHEMEAHAASAKSTAALDKAAVSGAIETARTALCAAREKLAQLPANATAAERAAAQVTVDEAFQKLLAALKPVLDARSALQGTAKAAAALMAEIDALDDRIGNVADKLVGYAKAARESIEGTSKTFGETWKPHEALLGATKPEDVACDKVQAPTSGPSTPSAGTPATSAPAGNTQTQTSPEQALNELRSVADAASKASGSFNPDDAAIKAAKAALCAEKTKGGPALDPLYKVLETRLQPLREARAQQCTWSAKAAELYAITEKLCGTNPPATELLDQAKAALDRAVGARNAVEDKVRPYLPLLRATAAAEVDCVG